MQTLMLFYTGCGLLLAALALPLVQRRIKPNRMFVLRFEDDQEGREKWYHATGYAGRRLLTAGIGIALAAFLLFSWPELELSIEEYTLSITGVVGGFMLWGIITSYLYIKSLS